MEADTTMTLNDEIVSQIDRSREKLQSIYSNLQPENYTLHYHDIWSLRADIEYIVAQIKLLNNIDDGEIGDQWKKSFASNLKQVRAERTVRQAFLETLALFQSLEEIENIIDFYKTCWKIKEKLTVLLNVVKPKHKLPHHKNAKTKAKKKKE